MKSPKSPESNENEITTLSTEQMEKASGGFEPLSGGTSGGGLGGQSRAEIERILSRLREQL